MKTLKIFIALAVISLSISGCSFDPDHSIRIKNEYSELVLDVKIGSVSYGDVNSGETTSYKPVDEGTHNLAGTTASSGELIGSVSISGKGTHKWTLTITSSGGVEIEED
ncbi:MAG: hypothetical protein CVT98_05490 [Bacteroidetes bacterium HGW-Bacteroidetes-15]|nr:MAG: hypothetical protein CVT98_05490 [Bacteroidetes bacterium HGW-Bacteroidetes-15]